MPEWIQLDGYFFDLDGTIMLEEQVLPGVPEALGALRGADKRILFLTNTTTRTRADCCLRLRRLGLQVELDEIVTAAYLSAVYLSEAQGKPTVYVVGEAAMMDELEEQGIAHTADPLSASHVLVGMDMHFDYGKLHRATKAVRNGASLIAANPDPNCPVIGDLIPDTWSMVKAIETASGVPAAAVIGKPSKYYGAKVLEKSGLPAERCLMVGDRLETDMLFGSNMGLRTALVLTGVASEQDMRQSPIKPDYVWTSLREFTTIFQTGGV
ncbi:HAD-IIA family hydrolase [Cohnella hashimotonis]|uniref:Acid sugar phosphatase n=1 Tax=Cohnella hashimotonis TaxID=2826895 RepID=A0ABT6TPA1_9BACL|nr:HAD-IIA family hydrolase [Cohnella hashimotonis]MDI4648656.1 HAD-IIA family hydrolase [Cohnella hashimotonis]